MSLVKNVLCLVIISLCAIALGQDDCPEQQQQLQPPTVIHNHCSSSLEDVVPLQQQAAAGLQGKPGKRGPKGDRGEKGAQGIQGANGNDGPMGEGCNATEIQEMKEKVNRMETDFKQRFAQLQEIIDELNRTESNQSDEGSALQCYVCTDNTELTAIDAIYNANCADASPPQSTLKSCQANETHCQYQYLKAGPFAATVKRGCAEEAISSSNTCNEVMCAIQRSCDTDGCNIGDKNYNGTTTAAPGSEDGQVKRQVESVLQDIVSTWRDEESQIMNIIPDFFSYSYDATSNSRIRDGGNDMYDDGNMLYLNAGNGVETSLQYNEIQPVEGTKVYAMTDAKSLPFYSVVFVNADEPSGSSSNRNEQVGMLSKVSFSVRSNTGADGSGRIEHDVGSYRGDGAIKVMEWASFQVYDAGDPTICEVYSAMSSDPDASLELITQFSDNTGYTNSNITVVKTGSGPYVLGYALLSVSSGAISKSKISSVLAVMMESIKTPLNK